MSQRKIERIYDARRSSDGAGVDIQRLVPPAGSNAFDPFLLLDEIKGDGGNGFPPHPHRGFETVTYMRRGAFQHEDHMGNRGQVGAGGAQWMTAGSGVIHSEMPLPDDGWLHGFQLWLNLPAEDKMMAPAYLDAQAASHPMLEHQGVRVRVIAGELSWAGQVAAVDLPPRKTDPHYYDIEISADATVELPLPETHRVFVKVYDGKVQVDDQTISSQQLAELGPGDQLVASSPAGAKLLLLAGVPLGEPVAQYGPFVMNTRQQIEQAVQDYRNGVLTKQSEPLSDR